MANLASGPVAASRRSGRCRVLVDPPAAGAWNMAVDEVLLDSAVRSGLGSLRFYCWEAPTLSLGYFQRWQQRETHEPSRHCPLVRRPSGGGALVHDDELTYSVILPPGHRLATGAAELYRTLHGVLVEALAEFGVAAEMLAVAPNELDTTEAFLCFQRRSAGDVVCRSAKIAGSAQRRRLGAVLQHGSILWGRSPAAPELPGIEQVSGVRIDGNSLIARLTTMLDDRLGMAFYDDGLASDEIEQATELVRNKFGHRGWTLRS